MKEHLPPGITIAKSENLEEWHMDLQVLDDNPLYQNETYRLKFTFGSKYPIGMYSTPSCFRTLPPSPPAIPDKRHISKSDHPSNPHFQSYRTPRSPIHRKPHHPDLPPPHSHPPTHLQQRNHLPRPPQLRRLVPRPNRRKRLR